MGFKDTLCSQEVNLCFIEGDGLADSVEGLGLELIFEDSSTFLV